MKDNEKMYIDKINEETAFLLEKIEEGWDQYGVVETQFNKLLLLDNKLITDGGLNYQKTKKEITDKIEEINKKKEELDKEIQKLLDQYKDNVQQLLKFMDDISKE